MRPGQFSGTVSASYDSFTTAKCIQNQVSYCRLLCESDLRPMTSLMLEHLQLCGCIVCLYAANLASRIVFKRLEPGWKSPGGGLHNFWQRQSTEVCSEESLKMVARAKYLSVCVTLMIIVGKTDYGCNQV